MYSRLARATTFSTERHRRISADPYRPEKLRTIMRAETERTIQEIKQALDLLRRHL
jgi:hypothetical protein